MKFFFDNNISPAIAKALRALRVDVQHLKERPGWEGGEVADVEWISALAGEDCIVVTGDDRIRRNPAERAALARAGLRVVFLPGHVVKLRLLKQASVLLDWWEDIDRDVKDLRPGECWLLSSKGKGTKVKP